MSYIVTGGAGFVGSNMVKTLNKYGIKDVVIVDNYDESKMPNLLDLQFTDYIDYSDGLDAVEQKLRDISKIDGIFHIGADADVLDYNPKHMMLLNYEFSKMYCKVASDNKVPFVYASSSAVYGNSKTQDATSEKVLPHNIYAWSKWLFDRYTIANMGTFGGRVIGFRFFNVFGWGEFHKGKNANIVYRFYRYLKDEGKIPLFKGDIIRDHVYAEDVTEVLYQAMINNQVKSGIYNLGGNHPISHLEIAGLVVETLMNNNVVPVISSPNDYIERIDMPEELRAKFQFYTHSENQESWISDITKGNYEKMRAYIENLIKYNK